MPIHPTRIVLILSLAAMMAACGQSENAAKPPTSVATTLAPAASATTAQAEKPRPLERAHLVQPAELSKWWLLSSTGDAKAPGYGKNLTAPTCVTVSYRIERGGATSQVKLEKMAPEGDLGAVAVSMIQGLHYTASEKNLGKDPVYTYVVLPFNAPDVNQGPSAVAARQSLLDQCKLDDFKLPAAP
ncbi:MAG: hypothetical protein JSR65_14075 [Proteobacteria bacterium]|nr:hypothetical protein [Pseudomonadota bacterium]